VISQDLDPGTGHRRHYEEGEEHHHRPPEQQACTGEPGFGPTTRLAPLIDQDAALPQDHQHHRHAQKPDKG
jgi:hypothetical protein